MDREDFKAQLTESIAFLTGLRAVLPQCVEQETIDGLAKVRDDPFLLKLLMATLLATLPKKS